LTVEARVKLLMEDYHFFVQDIATFCERLDALRALRGNEVINAWQEAARTGHVERVVRELLIDHYDPVYLASMKRNFAKFDEAHWVEPTDGDARTLADVAHKLLA
jgi:tRNA 2-selenouridine synthase